MWSSLRSVREIGRVSTLRLKLGRAPCNSKADRKGGNIRISLANYVRGGYYSSRGVESNPEMWIRRCIVVFAFFNMGAQEMIVLFLIVPLVVWSFWRIFSKAGFPGWLALGMLVPLVNLGLLFYLGFAEWPALPRSSFRTGGQPGSEVPS